MKLLLLLSFGGSLRKWHEAGIMSREMELYVEHLRRGHFEAVAIYSYDRDDAAMLPLIDCEEDVRRRIEIVGPRRAGRDLRAKLAHSFDFGLVRRLVRAGVTLVKTNQISGGWTALLARAAGAPVFARCGYLLSRRLWKNGKVPHAAVAAALEVALFTTARVISVTTEAAAAAARRMTLGLRPVFVAPTYVNTELFKASVSEKPRSNAVVYVGRLEPQKNVLNLVTACRMAGARLIMVGDGSLRRDVEARIASTGADVELIPRMQNRDIAALYRAHRHFVLPSVHEGLPKVLIEAMSAEMICVGTNVPGISDLIVDGRTGYLAPSLEPEAIAAAIQRAQNDPAAEEIGRAARAHALARHSLRNYAEREIGEIRRAIRS